jgi:hypothetical protein
MPEVTDPAVLAQLNGSYEPSPGPMTPPPLRQIRPRQPKLPPAQTPAQVTNDNLTNVLLEGQIDEKARKAEEERKLAERQKAGIGDAIHQMRGVIDAAEDAKGLSNGWFATGFGADAARLIGGTTAADVKAKLNTIGANTAFDRLQKMRDESPTGGALGAVTENELAMLRDSITSLEQSQSDEQFRDSMDKVISSYQRVIGRLEGRDPDGPDPAANPLAHGESTLRAELDQMKPDWIAKFQQRNPKANAEKAWQRVEQNARLKFENDPRIKRLSQGGASSGGWGKAMVVD